MKIPNLSAITAAALGTDYPGRDLIELGQRHEQAIAKIACVHQVPFDDVKVVVDSLLARGFTLDEIERDLTSVILDFSDTFERLEQFDWTKIVSEIEAVKPPNTPETPRAPPIGAKLSRRLGKRR